MTSSAHRLAAAIAAVFLAAAPGARAAPLDVVASFSILADMVHEIGGERVQVTALVGPNEDSHVFVPRPSHARLVAEADLVVVNGLGFEGWIDRLVAASASAATVVVATATIETGDDDGHDDRDDHGHSDHDDHGHNGHDDNGHNGHDDNGHSDHGGNGHNGHDDHGHDHHGVDYHLWQDAAHARAYVGTIAAALAAADPEGRAFYEANAQRYDAVLAALDREIREALADVPSERRLVLTAHDAFGHFERAYGIAFLAPQGLSTVDEPSAAGTAALARQLREGRIAAVFYENMANNTPVERIAAEAGIAVAGTLYADALSGPDGPAASYVAMMRHNATVLREALLPSPAP